MNFIVETIIEWFKNHIDTFNEIVEYLDFEIGLLNGERYYPMEEFDQFFDGVKPYEIVLKTFYGYCEDYKNEKGEHTQQFNPNDNFFTFNGYENLVSSNYKDYSSYLDEYTIKQMAENMDIMQYYINTDKELKSLFDWYKGE